MQRARIFVGACLMLAMSTGTGIAQGRGDRPATFSWTGFYAGINGGYGWGDNEVSYSPNDLAAFLGTCGGVGSGTCIPSASLDTSGALGGVQIGYNWKIDRSWVAGLEADLDWADIDARSKSPFHLGSTQDGSADASLKLTQLGTVRGRVGYLASPSLLVFATGGFAYGRVKQTLTVPNNIPVMGASGAQTGGGYSYSCTGGGPPCFSGSDSSVQTGWTIGAGFELALTGAISLKAEYLYVSLVDVQGKMQALEVFSGQPSSFTGSFGSVNESILRAGLNFRFN